MHGLGAGSVAIDAATDCTDLGGRAWGAAPVWCGVRRRGGGSRRGGSSDDATTDGGDAHANTEPYHDADFHSGAIAHCDRHPVAQPVGIVDSDGDTYGDDNRHGNNHRDFNANTEPDLHRHACTDREPDTVADIYAHTHGASHGHTCGLHRRL